MKAILTFHSIDTSGSLLSYPPTDFAALLAGLAAAALPVLDLDTLLQAGTRRGVAITFDDGMRSVCSAALPVLRDHAVPAHLYLATGAVGGNNRWPSQPPQAPGFDMLDWDEVERLHAGGVRIDAHTHNHPDMRGLDRQGMAQECEAADALIEHRLGRRPVYFAYPYGYRNASVCDFVRRRYRGAVTTELRTLGSAEDAAQLPRLDSYYLRSAWLRRNLDSLPARAYLRLRGVLRTLRGTQ